MRRAEVAMRMLKPILLLSLALSVWPQQPVTSDSALLRDFADRVGQYLKSHKKIEAQLPRLKPTADAAAIADHAHALAAGIRAARPEARQGDIFTPAIAAEFRRLLAAAMQGQDGARIRKSLRRAEPVHLPLSVNDTYPASVPLQSTPPSLLFALPKLPLELDYRLVGHDLLLRDVGANLIVDFISAAIP